MNSNGTNPTDHQTLERVRLFGGFVRDIGFPIIVAAFVLVRMESTVTKLATAMDALTAVVKERLVRDEEQQLRDIRRRWANEDEENRRQQSLTPQMKRGRDK